MATPTANMASSLDDSENTVASNDSLSDNDSLDTETEERVDLIRQWSQSHGSKSVVIVTAGKSGVGKSTFINTFLGLEGEEVSVNSLQPTSVTQDLNVYEKEINGVNVRVIDMPGLHATDHDSDESEIIIRELSAMTDGRADVVFFCMNILNRIDKVDLENIDTLTKAFGTEIWKHVIFVFTWADIALYGGNNLEKLVDKFIKEIHKHLVVKQVEVEIRSIYSFPSSDLGSEESEINKFDGIVGIPVSKNPNDPPEWRITLLLQVIRKCKKENIPAFLQLNAVHGIDWDEVRKTAAIATAGGVGGAAVGSAVGATFGAVIGGLLTAPIGGVGAVPTAAGGAAVGALIGSIGSGGTAAVATLAARIAFVIRVRQKMEKRARRKIKEMLEKEREQQKP